MKISRLRLKESFYNLFYSLSDRDFFNNDYIEIVKIESFKRYSIEAYLFLFYKTFMLII